MTHRVSRFRSLALLLVIAAALATGSCGACPPPLSPLVVGATRGAATIDIYGTWVRTNDPLGRAPKVWTYQFQFAPTGTTVNAGGTALQPLDAGTVAWVTAPATLAYPNSPPAPNPDANGMASVTLRFGPPGRGTDTLSVTITYGGVSGTAKTVFEVDQSAP